MVDYYSLIRPLLFQLSPERAFRVSMLLLSLSPSFLCPTLRDDPIELMGILFPNRIGLAAGLDDNADYVDVLAKLGVGFIEVGGVTPRPQSGNPYPRVFRLLRDQSIINRKGFANKGVDYCVERLKRRKSRVVVGVNIAKMKTTPLEDAFTDYQECYQKCHPVADFVTLNISSPNTPQLRELQSQGHLRDLLVKMVQLRERCQQQTGRRVPLTVKLAPDMNADDLEYAVKTIVDAGIDGIIATNTTLSRDTVADHPLAAEAGGLSGGGLTALSRQTLARILAIVGGALPVIAVGGILSAEEAKQRLNMGASLIQLYTGLIYQGPGLCQQISNHLAE